MFKQIKTYVLIPAGGSGRRMGYDIPKQFIKLGDYTILVQTLRKLEETLPDAEYIIPLIIGYKEQLESELSKAMIKTRIKICDAGKTRTESVMIGLETIKGEDGFVFIHDAVRPFINSAIINRLLSSANQKPHAAHIPVVPLKDSIRKMDGEKSSSVDRSNLFAVQTPQVFPIQSLVRAYMEVSDESFTDDASLFEACGGEIVTVPGDNENFKITSPDDLKRAEWLIQEHQRTP